MKSAYTPGTAPIETSVAAAHGEHMRGRGERFDAVPFFWTEQYDFGLAYVGHAEGWDQAESWDQAEIDWRLDAGTQDCTITYRRAGKKLAVAVVHRDLDGVRAELEFEQATAKLA